MEHGLDPDLTGLAQPVASFQPVGAELRGNGERQGQAGDVTLESPRWRSNVPVNVLKLEAFSYCFI
jgi:hypothetical protein